MSADPKPPTKSRVRTLNGDVLYLDVSEVYGVAPGIFSGAQQGSILNGQRCLTIFAKSGMTWVLADNAANRTVLNIANIDMPI